MSIMNKKEKDISIIIPLYKGKKFCIRLLEMINENCMYKDLYKICEIEVILVNDYPEEEIIFEKKRRYFTIEVLNQEKNMGIQSSRIKGVLYCKGEYIIMLDQDDLIKENWLYSQWNKIISENCNFCVCNGWRGRFRTLWNEQTFEACVNDLNYYLEFGNAICSPAQVIIKKKYLPKEWLQNIQTQNGADDFFLWIMVLKSGEKFCVNKEYLYYHTPDRTKNSIKDMEMIKSLKETLKLLILIGGLEEKELALFRKQIEQKERLNSDYIFDVDKSIKYYKLFNLMLDWMKLRNKGIRISDFCKKHNYLNIAIYGMGYIGEYLYDELPDCDIKIVYAIDRSARDFSQKLSIFKIEDELVSVDAVIVTMVENTEEIIGIVKEKLDCPVITISEIIWNLKTDNI